MHSSIPPPMPFDDEADTAVNWLATWPDEVPTQPEIEAIGEGPATVRTP